MAAQPASPLSTSLVRKGEAKAADPAAAAVTPPLVQQAMELPADPPPAPRHAPMPMVAGPIMRPVPLNTVQRKAGTLRLPIPISEGLRTMSHFTRRPMQSILEEGAVRMLDDWNPNWRELLPEG